MNRRAFGVLALAARWPSGDVVPTACKSVLMGSLLAVGFQLEHQPKFRRDWSLLTFGNIYRRGTRHGFLVCADTNREHSPTNSISLSTSRTTLSVFSTYSVGPPLDSSF